MQLCHRIELVFTITMVLHSTLYLFWKPRYGSCQFLFTHFFSATASSPDTYYRSFERSYQGESSDVGYETRGRVSIEDVGYYRRINYSGLIRDINAFHFWPCL